MENIFFNFLQFSVMYNINSYLDTPFPIKQITVFEIIIKTIMLKYILSMHLKT